MTRVLATAALAIVITAEAPVQEKFRSSADMVPVYVSVSGRNGRQIPGLRQDDFTVLDSGKRQPIVFFSAERRPFAVALVLDGTFSMLFGSAFARQLDAARALAEALDRDDEVALGSLKRALFELSIDKGAIGRWFRQPLNLLASDVSRTGVEAESQEGLEWAVSSLSRYEGRRIVVLFTDGRSRVGSAPVGNSALNNGDTAQLAGQLVNRAERADVSIHAMAFDDSMVEEAFLTAFASTGGGASLIARDANLSSVARELVDELHHEYRLGFTPAQFDGRSHKIEVRVNRSGAKVRARTRYFSPKR